MKKMNASLTPRGRGKTSAHAAILPRPAAPEAHASVMVGEVLAALDLHDGELVLDATAGQGGHSAAMLKAADVCVIALDADARFAAAARARLTPFGSRATVAEANFADLEEVLAREHIETVDKALFDLGWNRGQLGSGRGFSFLYDEPLHMGYSERPRSGFTAAEVLNTWSEEGLANALFGYGEERYARRIARAVVEARQAHPIETTSQFVEIVRTAVPGAYARGKTHPATKSFQALRIAVNDELGAMDRGLRAAWARLSSGGRLAVITFHSIEDRAVKRLFKELAADGGRLVTKKPLVPSKEELHANPSARSAKLRAIEKI